MKPSTIRLSTEDMQMLEAIARAEGTTVSALLRQAVAALIAERRRDPAFQRRLAERVAKDRVLLERLAGTGNAGGGSRDGGEST
jgi:predicted DNA-binding protein